MQLLDAHHTADGTLRVTFAHVTGLTTIEGSPEEVAELSVAMREVAVLAAAAGDAEDAWIRDVRVGGDVVRLGVDTGQRTRLQVVRTEP